MKLRELAEALPFGAHVTVRAMTVPVYVTVCEQREPTFLGSTITRGTGVYHVNPDSFSVHGDLRPSDWPGEAIPDPEEHRPGQLGLEPLGVVDHFHQGAHRRLRRLPMEPMRGLGEEPVRAVVVGHTRRKEGRIFEPFGWGRGDGDQRELIVRRTVPVVQVALHTGGRARLVDAWHEDVKLCA